MKYYATLDVKHSMLTLVDEYCEEVFCDIITPEGFPFTTAELKLAEIGFTRVGEWDQAGESWAIECVEGKPVTNHSEMRDNALGNAERVLKEAESSVQEAHLSKHLTLAQLYIALAHELGSSGV